MKIVHSSHKNAFSCQIQRKEATGSMATTGGIKHSSNEFATGAEKRKKDRQKGNARSGAGDSAGKSETLGVRDALVKCFY